MDWAWERIANVANDAKQQNRGPERERESIKYVICICTRNAHVQIFMSSLALTRSPFLAVQFDPPNIYNIPYIRFGAVQIYKQLLNRFNSISEKSSLNSAEEMQRGMEVVYIASEPRLGLQTFYVCAEIAQIIFGEPVSIVYITIYMCVCVFAYVCLHSIAAPNEKMAFM